MAVVRSLSEQVGPVTGAAAVYGVSGVVALIALACDGRKRRQIVHLPGKYLAGCGASGSTNPQALSPNFGVTPFQ